MVKIRDNQKLLLSSEDVVMRQQVADLIGCFREELDDHRLAINENTVELASSMEFLSELNSKIEKLAERIDDLALLVKGVPECPSFEIKPLSAREREVFQELYLLTESAPYASYDALARKCCLTKEMISLAVSSMVHKGVPVLKRMNGNQVLLKLDAVFREHQAKRNLVGVSSLLGFL